MNNRGSAFYPSIFTVFILTMVIIVLAQANNNVDTSTIDKTIETLNWTKIGANVSNNLQNIAQNSQSEPVKVILNVANKAIDFMGYAVFEVTKLAMNLAKDNPDIINYKVLMCLLIIGLISPAIYPAFIITVSLILIIKEWRQNKKEKNSLKKLVKGGLNE